MNKTYKTLLIIAGSLVVTIIISFMFLILNMHYLQKGRGVSSSDDLAIRKYIEHFYATLKISQLQTNSWFLEGKVNFYIQNSNSPLEEDRYGLNGNAYSSALFVKKIKKFLNYAGTMQSYSINHIEYYLQPYDLSESDLYFAKVEVFYINQKTIESFWLKNVNGKWKIYRYWIELQ